MRSLILASTLAVTTLAACAGRGSVAGSGGMRTITVEEMEGIPAENLLVLIQELRPSWLIGSPVRDPADPTETGGPIILVDGVPPRPLYTLQFMPPAGVEEIRYLTSFDAELRYRVRAPSGAIFVKTRPSVGPGHEIRPDTARRPSYSRIDPPPPGDDPCLSRCQGPGEKVDKPGAGLPALA